MVGAYDYLWSRHSLIRMATRFKDQNIMKLINSSVVANKRIKRKIKESCPISGKKYMKQGFSGRYYMYNRKHSIVFVVGAPNEVITVFHLDNKEEEMTKEVSHTEKAHAKLSASGSSIWLNCPGSVEAQEPYEDKGSMFAEEGTMAHEIADICLSTGNDAEAYIGRTLESLKIKLSQYKSTHKIEKIMADYVQEYLDYVRAHETENSTLYTEQRVDFSNVVPEGFGTLDAAVLVYDERILHIFDLKYGNGVTVDAFENTQGQMYGTGFYNEYGFLDAFDTIRIHIVQPRKSNFPYWDISVKDLITFGKSVAEKAALALTKDAPRVPGEKQCQWCDARYDCSARLKLTENIVRAAFDELDDNAPDANTLTIEQKGLILRHKKFIERFLKDIESSAYDLLSSGEPFPGRKLVQGTANRIIPFEAEAGLVDKLGEDAYNKKLKGIGDLEKLLGKKEVAAIAVRPEGKIVMVEESDKRSAVLMTSVASEFDKFDED